MAAPAVKAETLTIEISRIKVVRNPPESKLTDLGVRQWPKLLGMLPAPRGAGIVAARVPKKVLQFAGIDDVFTSSRGSTKTLGNFVKATFDCLLKTYGFLTPDFWRETNFTRSPYQEFTDLLGKQHIAEITEPEAGRSLA